MKNAKPSSAKGSPITEPKVPISPGHSSPISNDRMVPDTAPTAKRTPATFAHRRASRIASTSP